MKRPSALLSTLVLISLLLATAVANTAAEAPTPTQPSGVERPRGFSTSGKWEFGTLRGHEPNEPTIYSSDLKATATWAPKLLIVGPVRLSLFLPTHKANVSDAVVEIYSGGKITPVHADMKTGDPRWLLLGQFEFAGKGEEYVRVRAGSSGNVRLSGLKLEILDGTEGAVWQTLVLDKLLPYNLSELKLKKDAPANLRKGPLQPEQWELAFSDEFNGDGLDTNVWKSAQGETWGRLLSARFPENAVVKNGLLQLVTRKENRGGKEWTSAMISTKNFRQKYGYWESRYRYAAATGLNQAFWMNPFAKDKSKGFEIDINEGHYPSDVNPTLHQNGLPSKSHRFVADYDLAADFHIYAVEWNERETVFYFDGQEIHRAPNTTAHLEVPAIYSTAVLTWGGPVTDAMDGKSMDVDWVRVYRRKSDSVHPKEKSVEQSLNKAKWVFQGKPSRGSLTSNSLWSTTKRRRWITRWSATSPTRWMEPVCIAAAKPAASIP